MVPGLEALPLVLAGTVAGVWDRWSQRRHRQQGGMNADVHPASSPFSIHTRSPLH